MGRKSLVPGIIFWSRCGGEFNAGTSTLCTLTPKRGRSVGAEGSTFVKMLNFKKGGLTRILSLI